MSRQVDSVNGGRRRALVLVTEALDLLDADGSAADAAAHLALAQQCLRRSSAKMGEESASELGGSDLNADQSRVSVTNV